MRSVLLSVLDDAMFDTPDAGHYRITMQGGELRCTVYSPREAIPTGCCPKPGHRVHARKLLRRAKVFSDRRPDGYLLGEPGDWLVARAGNTSHVHIVKAESFPKLYFQVSTDGD